MAARQCHDFRNCASMCKSNLRNSEPVPEQLVQGGYRTGAGEDCLIQHTHQCRSNNSSCLPLPLSNSLDEHTVGLGNESLDAGKLNWKERIRHYTWTFFAMTMATGGIANVLYAGKSCTYTNTYTCIGLQLTHPYSTLSFPRTWPDWGRILPLQSSTFHSEYSFDRVTLLLPSRYFKNLILTSSRAAVCSQCCRFVWDNSHQHFSVRC